MPRFKSIIFYQNSSKIKFILQKNAKFLSAGSSAPILPCLRRLGSSPPGPLNSSLPIANFRLRAWCFYRCFVILCKLILRLADAYGLPQVALSLNKFAHPCSKVYTMRKRKIAKDCEYKSTICKNATRYWLNRKSYKAKNLSRKT